MKIEGKGWSQHGMREWLAVVVVVLGVMVPGTCVHGQNESISALDAGAQDGGTKENVDSGSTERLPGDGKDQTAGGDSSGDVVPGLIDGDAPAGISDSVIPQVLSGPEREKLGLRQGRFDLPTLAAASTALSGGNRDGERHPETFVQQFGEYTEPLPESGSQRDADWHWSWCVWSAPNTFSNPRYFEDRMLERHGQECIGCFQPLASGARFFGAVPMLPYLWAVSNPCEREYSLGYYPAGQRAPIMLQRPPYENRAAVVEAGAAAGLIIGFP